MHPLFCVDKLLSPRRAARGTGSTCRAGTRRQCPTLARCIEIWPCPCFPAQSARRPLKALSDRCNPVSTPSLPKEVTQAAPQ